MFKIDVGLLKCGGVACFQVRRNICRRPNCGCQRHKGSWHQNGCQWCLQAVEDVQRRRSSSCYAQVGNNTGVQFGNDSRRLWVVIAAIQCFFFINSFHFFYQTVRRTTCGRTTCAPCTKTLRFGNRRIRVRLLTHPIVQCSNCWPIVPVVFCQKPLYPVVPSLNKGRYIFTCLFYSNRFFLSGSSTARLVIVTIP